MYCHQCNHARPWIRRLVWMSLFPSLFWNIPLLDMCHHLCEPIFNDQS